MPVQLTAQPIDISLHPTANPDSFEVRLHSEATYDGVINAVFTIRWEVASGGVATNADVRRACGAYSMLNYGGSVDIGPYRYFTLVVFGDRLLSLAGCQSIGPAGMLIGTVRIRQLSGCRNVSLVQNAFTNLNNLDYYMSVNGVDQTGVITSAPITGGDCPPCEPPVITGTTSAPVPYCGYGVDMNVTATGTDLDYAWQKPNGSYWATTAAAQDPYATAGTYTVVVSNVCGWDTAPVEAVVDHDLCMPPVFDSVWYVPAGPMNIQLRTALNGSCASVSWIMPWGGVVEESSNHVVPLYNVPAGTYTAIAVNACGSDTMVLDLVPPVPCTLPTINNATVTTVGLCDGSPIIFSASASGPAPLTFGWLSPVGEQLPTTGNFSLAQAPWGIYTFSATNTCGSSTATVYHGGEDTTGLAQCVPPVIDTIHTVGFGGTACYMDTVQFIPVYTNTGICAQTRWSRGNTTLSWDDTLSLVVNTNGPIRFTASNACGQASVLIPVELVFPDQPAHRICPPVSAPLSLDSMMHYTAEHTDGQWFRNGMPHGAFFDPTVDGSGAYDYCLPVGNNPVCPVVRLMVLLMPPAYAGEDSSVVVCSSDPPFQLFDMLGGEPLPGGIWVHNGTGASSTFDPATSAPGLYRYFKTSGQFLEVYCRDTAFLTITVNPELTYYADTDGDGLGDPLDSLQSCDPLPGYVTEANDDCPLVFGTIGSPCDDGNALTINDSLGVDCQCVGLSTVGMEEATNAGWQLWPNPATELLQLQGPPGTGRVLLHLVDAAGREVRRWQRTLEGAPLELSLAGLPSGTYALRIVGKDAVPVLRVVVQR